MSKRGSTTTGLTAAQVGQSRHRARNAPVTTHWLTWRHLRCKVIARADFLSRGWTLLELHVIAARDTPCPITTTGFLAYQIDAEELAMAGGPAAFFCAWMDREAATKRYQQVEFRWRQGDLLDQLALCDEGGRA